jgi:hypothetical protein
MSVLERYGDLLRSGIDPFAVLEAASESILITSADLEKVIRAATEPFEDKEVAKFSIGGPHVQIASGAVISFAYSLSPHSR